MQIDDEIYFKTNPLKIERGNIIYINKDVTDEEEWEYAIVRVEISDNQHIDSKIYINDMLDKSEAQADYELQEEIRELEDMIRGCNAKLRELRG